MIVTAWKGSNARKTQPAGYGLKAKSADRDKYFYNQWKTVFIHFEGVI